MSRFQAPARLRLVVSNTRAFSPLEHLDRCNASNLSAASPRGEALRPCSISLTDDGASPMASPISESVIPVDRSAEIRNAQVVDSMPRTLRHTVNASQRHHVTEFRENRSMAPPKELLRDAHPGKRVRLWRNHRKMTLGQLSARCGLSPGAISDFEHERQDETGKLIQIAQALRINPHYLAAGVGDPEDLSAPPPVDGNDWPFSFPRAKLDDLDTNERELFDLKVERVLTEIKAKRQRAHLKRRGSGSG